LACKEGIDMKVLRLLPIAGLRWVLRLCLLVTWAASVPLYAQEFRAGTAKVKITPDELGWLGGYGHRNKPAEGVAADLWARALALEDKRGQRGVLVSADIHIFPRRLHREIVEAARKTLGLREHEIMLVATHTHSGPSLPDGFEPLICWDLTERDMATLRATADRIRERILDAMGRALANLQPARLSFGHGEARFGVNRRIRKDNGDYTFGANPEGVTDPVVAVLRIEWPDGTPRAVVFTYACHCTSIRNGHEGFYRYHPDYAGVAADAIEGRFPGATALYLTGCAGEIDPQPLGGVPQAELHGRSLAASVLAVLNKNHQRAIGGPFRIKYQEIRLPLAPCPPRQKYVDLSESRVSYRRRHAKQMLAQIDAGKVPTEIPLPIQVLRFGEDLTLVALGGEVGVDYALRLKKELGKERTWVVAYANEVPCYIPSERVLDEGGYEAGWDRDQGPAVPGATSSILFYGWPAPLAPGVEDRVVAAVHNLLKN
jgi:hypothetical protein